MSGRATDYEQRTRLAWARTGLSVVGLALVVARLALLEDSWPTLGVAAGALLSGAVAVLTRSIVATVAAVCFAGLAALALLLI